MDLSQLTDVEKYRKQLEMDLNLAQVVHRSMIPSSGRRGDLEIVCDFNPMIGIGGDYASVHFQDDQHVVIGICDVSGHGIAAALLASRVNSFVLNIAPSVHHPCEVVEALNEFVYENFQETNLYLTFLCLFADLDEQSLVFSGCGHPPSLLYQKKEDQIVRLQSENTVIGLFETLSRKCSMLKIPFKRGDRLLLYTDGVTEATNPNGEILGMSKLEAILRETVRRSLRESIDSITCLLSEFRADHPADDDQLLLAVSFLEEPTAAS